MRNPRRAGKKWLVGAPEYVLDVLDNPTYGDRYTVLFTGKLLCCDERRGTIIPYLSMSGAPEHPQGVSMWGELTSFEAAGFRYREGKHRIHWLDLPEHIRKHVVARAEQD